MNNTRDSATLHKILESDARIFRVLGKINSAVSTAASFDEAIRAGLRMITDSGICDYVIVWCLNEAENVCCPYYWIFPADVTVQRRAPGDGIVGRVCISGEAESVFSVSDNEELSMADAVSAVCVPFSIGEGFRGCMEFIKGGESEPFTPEEAETCSIIALMSEISIRESAPLPDAGGTKAVIMSAKNVTKSFLSGGSVSQVLKGVNLDVFDGEMLCLLGESGCGKSTFLNILGGLLDADGGSLSFMGDEMLNASEEELTEYRRKYVGFVFQSYNLMPNLTAKQNLDLIGELVGDAMDSDEALELVGMGGKGGSYPSQLSGGQQQRISIARALIKKPKLIFADEPTAALDYKTSIEILNVFERIKKTGTTILMVTHNEEITRMADRVVRFRDGRTHEIIINRHPARADELIW